MRSPSAGTTETLKKISGLPWPEALLTTDLDPVFWVPSRVGATSAWWGHVPFAHWFVAAIRPNIVVELGTHNGVSFAAFCEAMQRRAIKGRCCAVDTWKRDEHDGSAADSVFRDFSAFYQAHYGAFAELLRLTADEALPSFADGSIDLLHIDELHTYEALRRDFDNWLPKLSDRGVVMLHDTNVRQQPIGVWKLWVELRDRYPSFEFLHSNGLGIVAVGRNAVEPVMELCNLEPDAADVLRERFAHLGARWETADLAARANARIEEQQARITSLDAQIEEQGARIASLDAQIAEQGTRIASLRVANAAQRSTLRAEIAAIHASTSWRITAPLRAIKTAGSIKRTRGASLKTFLRIRSAVDSLHLPKDRLLPGRETVIVAVHEATRSGAAILAWNIIGELRQRYNVIALLKRGGPIEQAISDISCGVVTLPESFTIDDAKVDALARRLVQHYSPKYLVANSVETRYFVPAFERAGVPAIALIHEFSSNIRPLGSLGHLLDSASEIVFSAQIVADSLLTDYPSLEARQFKILPQGVSRLPPNNVAVSQNEFTKGDLTPIPNDDGSILVIGIGAINMRKGVEFFIAAAASVQRQKPSRRVTFCWVGKCYWSDQPYLDYLNEQIKRAGVEASFDFLGEFEDLEPLYSRADICFLSSRLDPLPNIAIDSAIRGIPVICFDQASGMAEILKASKETRDLVVPYLDAEAAARLIVEFADHPARLSDMSAAIRVVGRKHFDMGQYVEAIDRLGREAVRANEQVERDHQLIARSGLFNAQLNIGELASSMTTDAAIIRYLRLSRLISPRGRPRTGLLVRRPLEGFHPLIYASDNLAYDEAGFEDPVAHYIRTDFPVGRWRHEVIRPGANVRAGGSALRVAVHGHFHYPDLLTDFIGRLRRNQTAVDLLLTTTSDDRAGTISEIISRLGVKHATIMVVPNRGRDVGALLTGLSQVALFGYEVIGHFHGKRSPHVDAAIGEAWRNALWENLIGGEHNMMDVVMNSFAADGTLGLVFAEDPNLADWDENRTIADGLAARMGLSLPLPNHFDFPVGTMFWARPQALRPLMDLGIGWDAYPDEPVAPDGTMLHALERLVPFAAEHAGYRYATTYLKECVR
jgi:glycosyltransferase involved in cell wall biosynthesis